MGAGADVGLLEVIGRRALAHKLERIRRDLEEGKSVEVNPKAKLALVAVGLMAIDRLVEATRQYLAQDVTPTMGEWSHAAVIALIGAALYWARSPKDATTIAAIEQGGEDRPQPETPSK